MRRVECVGGPLDGSEIEMADGVAEVEITMADGTRHRYASLDPSADRPSETLAWLGRK